MASENGKPRIIGLMVTGAEADRYLEKSLQEFKRLCDDAVIATNNADLKTKKLIKQYGYWQYEDDREWGKFQPAIKTDLLRRIAQLRPDYILPLDADETLPTVSRNDLEELGRGIDVAAYFYVINLWNTEQRYARGLGFWNIRFFKFLPQYGLEYANKPVHCGLAPPIAYKYGTHVPHLMVHYGLMKKEDRMRKVDRYNQYDPNAVHKGRDYYDALASDATGSMYNQEAVLLKVKEEVDRMGDQKKHIYA